MAKKPQKKKLPAKKVSVTKSVAPKRAKSKSTALAPMQALVTVPIEEINKPITYKGKLSIIPTPFTERQIMQMIAPTPRNVVLKRPGKGGKDFDYIPGWWFKKKLNFTFGWMHDFEILGERIDGDFVTVKGKLVVKNSKGQALVTKTDFGGHPIQYLKDGKGYVDISNDFKAAATDCLKRCAVQLGIGLDVYSKGEYEGAKPADPQAPQSPASTKPATRATVINVESAEVKPKAGDQDYLAKLNGRLEQLGYTSESRKKEYVLTKADIVINDWSSLTQAKAQMLIAVLARANAQKKK